MQRVANEMKHWMIIIIFVCTATATALVYAGGPDSIIGIWNTEKKDAKIEIYACGKRYCGKIVWLKEPTYPAHSKVGMLGMPILDSNNPEPSHRIIPLVGLQMLFDFVFSGNNVWGGGKIYDSDDGKTYSGKMELLSNNKLKLRGYIGIILFGGSTIWTKEEGHEEHEY